MADKEHNMLQDKKLILVEKRMKEISRILGVQYSEPFRIKGDRNTYEIGLDGINYFLSSKRPKEDILIKLLNGDLEIETDILINEEKEYINKFLTKKLGENWKDWVNYFIIESFSDGFMLKVEYKINFCDMQIYRKMLWIHSTGYDANNETGIYWFACMEKGMKYNIKELDLDKPITNLKEDKSMAENKMNQVAEMLGVEMGVPFKIKGYIYNPCKLTENTFVNSRGNTIYNRLFQLLIGELEIEKPILDDVEKRYLEGVLRPFKDRVTHIVKLAFLEGVEFIKVGYNELDETNDEMPFPLFKEGTMYNGMEPDKEYTLQELGLFEDEI